MIKKSILSLICVSVTSFSVAGEWHYLGDSGNTCSAIDMSSITKVDEEIVGAWMLTVLENKKIGYFIRWQQTNCTKKLVRADEYIFYAPDGEPIKTIIRNENWERIIPETVGEELFNCMCGNATSHLVKMPYAEYATFLRKFLEESQNTK